MLEPIRTDDSQKFNEEAVKLLEIEYGSKRLHTFGYNTPLIQQGEVAGQNFFFVVTSNPGLLDIEDTRYERTIATIGGRGTVVGEIAALDPNIPRTMSVIAASSTVDAIQLSIEDVRKWNMQGHPWSGMNMFMYNLASARKEILLLNRPVQTTLLRRLPIF